MRLVIEFPYDLRRTIHEQGGKTVIRLREIPRWYDIEVVKDQVPEEEVAVAEVEDEQPTKKRGRPKKDDSDSH